MGRYHIYINGEWKDACSEDIYIRHSITGDWKKVRSGDRVMVHGIWELIECGEPCNQKTVYSGGVNYPTPHEFTLDLGSSTGTVHIECRAGENPDKFQLWWNGNKVADSGYIGDKRNYQWRLDDMNINESINRVGYQILKFNKTLASPNLLTVKVFSPLSGTLWEVWPHCPNVLIPHGIVNVYNTVNSLSTGIRVTYVKQGLTNNQYTFDGAGQSIGNTLRDGNNTIRIGTGGPIIPNVRVRITQGTTVLFEETKDIGFTNADRLDIPIYIENGKTYNINIDQV